MGAAHPSARSERRGKARLALAQQFVLSGETSEIWFQSTDVTKLRTECSDASEACLANVIPDPGVVLPPHGDS